MAAILQIFTTFGFWAGAVGGFGAGRAYQVFHRARIDRRDAVAHSRRTRRILFRSIPRAIAAIALLVVVSVALIRVLAANPDVLYPDQRTPAEVPTPSETK